MSLIYKHDNGASIHQCGALEIPLKLKLYDLSLVVLSARGYQPMTKGPKSLLSTARIYVPLEDSGDLEGAALDDTIARASQAAQQVVQHVAKGHSALITCQAGLNRSGLISGMAIRRLSGLPGIDVVTLIRKRRSRWALSNSLFASIVESW